MGRGILYFFGKSVIDSSSPLPFQEMLNKEMPHSEMQIKFGSQLRHQEPEGTPQL